MSITLDTMATKGATELRAKALIDCGPVVVKAWLENSGTFRSLTEGKDKRPTMLHYIAEHGGLGVRKVLEGDPRMGDILDGDGRSVEDVLRKRSVSPTGEKLESIIRKAEPPSAAGRQAT